MNMVFVVDRVYFFTLQSLSKEMLHLQLYSLVVYGQLSCSVSCAKITESCSLSVKTMLKFLRGYFEDVA